MQNHSDQQVLITVLNTSLWHYEYEKHMHKIGHPIKVERFLVSLYHQNCFSLDVLQMRKLLILHVLKSSLVLLK